MVTMKSTWNFCRMIHRIQQLLAVINLDMVNNLQNLHQMIFIMTFIIMKFYLLPPLNTKHPHQQEPLGTTLHR